MTYKFSGFGFFGYLFVIGMLFGFPGVMKGQSTQVKTLLLKNITIIDGTGAKPYRGSVRIRDENIEAIFQDGEVIPSDPEMEVRDGSRQWVIPGMVDLLTHISARSYISDQSPYRMDELFGDILRRDQKERLSIYQELLHHCLRNGITTFVDSISSLADLEILQTKLDDKTFPNFYSLGPILSPRGGHPAVLDDTGWKYELPIDHSAATAVVEIQTELEKWFTRYPLAGLKIAVDGPSETGGTAPRVPKALIEAVVRTAKAHGKPVFFLAFSDQGIQDAAAAGASVKLGVPIVIGNPGLTPKPETWEALRTHDVKLLSITATWGANLWRYMEDATRSAPNRTPLIYDGNSYFNHLPEEARRHYEGYLQRYVHGDAATRKWVEASGENLSKIVHQQLMQAVQGSHPLNLIPTADSGATWAFHGNLWMELEGLKGIITPLEAISQVTLGAARTMGLEKKVGSIEVGKMADLVVLNADPLADARNLQAIAFVLKAGMDVKSW